MALANGCANALPPADLVLLGQGSPLCSPVVEHIEHWDQPTPLGFSAIEALRHLGGERSSDLIWMPAVDRPEYSMDYGPERGRSSLRVRLVAGAGDIHYREELLAHDAPEGSECAPAVLELPVEVSLRSDAFALDETVQARLVARSPYRAELVQRLEPHGLTGGLVIDDLGSRDTNWQYRVASLHVRMLLWEGGSQGSLEAEVWGSVTRSAPREMRAAAPVAVPMNAREPLALWPSADVCPEPARALPSDARPLGFSAADVLGVLSRSPEHALEWSDGSRAELELEFQPLASVLCQEIEDELVFEARLRARTRDGRVDSSVPVLVRAQVDGDAPGEIVVQTAASEAAAPNLEVDATFHAGHSAGTLALNGSSASSEAAASPPRPSSGSWSR